MSGVIRWRWIVNLHMVGNPLLGRRGCGTHTSPRRWTRRLRCAVVVFTVTVHDSQWQSCGRPQHSRSLCWLRLHGALTAVVVVVVVAGCVPVRPYVVPVHVLVVRPPVLLEQRAVCRVTHRLWGHVVVPTQVHTRADTRGQQPQPFRNVVGVGRRAQGGPSQQQVTDANVP